MKLIIYTITIILSIICAQDRSLIFTTGAPLGSCIPSNNPCNTDGDCLIGETCEPPESHSIEFGNLHHKRFATYQCGTGSCTRGFWMGGADEPAPGGLKAGHHIDYVDIRSGGNSEDWGDLTRGRSGCTAFSDCHGGLGGF